MNISKGISISFANDTITRIRPSVKSERGSNVPDWKSADYLDIENCSVQPAATSIDTDNRVSGISDSVTVYAPIDSDIEEGDRIMIDSKIYVISGSPRKWKSPSGSLTHMMLILTRYSG